MRFSNFLRRADFFSGSWLNVFTNDMSIFELPMEHEGEIVNGDDR